MSGDLQAIIGEYDMFIYDTVAGILDRGAIVDEETVRLVKTRILYSCEEIYLERYTVRSFGGVGNFQRPVQKVRDSLKVYRRILLEKKWQEQRHMLLAIKDRR